MGLLKVHTAQNVLLEFPVGNVGQRILAGFLDLLVCVVYYFLASWIFEGLMGAVFIDESPNLIFYIVVVLPITFYLPTIEYLWNGRTLGKAALKMRVVRLDGSSATLGDIILRWLIRTIDVKLGFALMLLVPLFPTAEARESMTYVSYFFWIFPIPVVGVISMASSSTCQRLGDRVANTTVVLVKRTVSLEDTILKVTETDYEPTYQNVLKLSDKDMRIIKDTLERAQKSRDYSDVGKLADKAREILDIRDDSRPVVLLKTLIKDYNHLAKSEAN